MDDSLALENMRREVLAMGATALQGDRRWGYGLVILSALAPLGLFLKPQAGAYAAVASLAALLALASYDHLKRRLALSAALIPLLTMVDLSVIQDSAFEQTAILYVAMLGLAVVCRRLWQVSAPATPVSRLSKRLAYPGAIIIGVLVGLLSAKLLSTGYIFGGVAVWKLIILAVAGGVAEEQLFRGLIQRQAAQLLRPAYAAGLAVLLYVPLSLSHFSAWAPVIGLLSAGLLSGAYALKPSLVLTTSLNITSKLVYVALTLGVILR